MVRPRQAGESCRGGETCSAVADLGEQPGGSDGPGAGQAGEDVRVDVHGELLADLLGQGLDLLDQGGQHGQQSAGDVGLGDVVAARPARCGHEPRMQQGPGRCGRCSRRRSARR